MPVVLRWCVLHNCFEPSPIFVPEFPITASECYTDAVTGKICNQFILRYFPLTEPGNCAQQFLSESQGIGPIGTKAICINPLFIRVTIVTDDKELFRPSSNNTLFQLPKTWDLSSLSWLYFNIVKTNKAKLLCS